MANSAHSARSNVRDVDKLDNAAIKAPAQHWDGVLRHRPRHRLEVVELAVQSSGSAIL
jgi:hypothetical protein